LNRPNLINPIIYSAEALKIILGITIGGLMIVFPKLACRATGFSIQYHLFLFTIFATELYASVGSYRAVSIPTEGKMHHALELNPCTSTSNVK
jgi:hypothetical protein